uniref:Thiol:disulfide interchange protein n=1 Tax=Caloglossa beccarii TaxID=131038 RepID=A0A1Z1M8N5_9FLOR|nr:thiol:disulfide interchange protein [Caloglossa beccarii]ARW62211.1 thiol:disulfide interchange protein [Caloglossa beccarii]
MLLFSNFLYFFETILYELQQKVTLLLMSTNSSLPTNTFLLLIFASILTILNPCFLSLFPLSISYFNTYTKQIEKSAFLIGLISNIFFSILVTNFISYNFFNIIRVPFFSLIIIILLSLNLLQIFNFSYYLNIVSFRNIFKLNINKKTHLASILIPCYSTGFIIGSTIVLCNTPIFTMIHFWLYNFHEKNFIYIHLFVYFISCVILFILIFYLFVHYLQIYIFAYISNAMIPFWGFLTLTTSLFFLLEKIFL